MRSEAYGRLLNALEDSPLYTWGQPLGLWAVVAEDPFVITPVLIGVAGLDVEQIVQIARGWPGEATVRVPGLMLVAEHMERHERTAIVIHQDGDLVVMQKRQAHPLVVIDAAGSSSSALVDAARLIGAAAWR